MPKEQFCNKSMIEDFGTWLIYEKKSIHGRGMKTDSIIEYIRKVMNEAKVLYGFHEFFSGLEESAPPRTHWYRKFTEQVRTHAASKAINDGMPITESAPYFSRKTVADICETYYGANSTEGCYRYVCSNKNLNTHINSSPYHRAFIILFIFLAVGRAGEVATSNWDKTLWCPINQNLRLLWSSTKTSKEKSLGIFSERRYPFMDYYWLLSNLFMMGYFVQNRSDFGDRFFFPSLRDMQPQSVAPKISQFLEILRPESTNKQYGKVNSLPPDVSSGSLRHSSINTMAALGVPLESMVSMTGHFLTNMSAIYEYLNVTVTSTTIGMLALTGWDVPSHVTFVKAPATPTLEALRESQVISEDHLNALIDRVYMLHYDFTSFCSIGGSHREMIECMFATTLMHFKETHNKYPQHEISIRLRNHVIELGLKQTQEAALRLLFDLGAKIKADWQLKTLPAPQISEHALLTTITQLNESISSSRAGQLQFEGFARSKFAQI